MKFKSITLISCLCCAMYCKVQFNLLRIFPLPYHSPKFGFILPPIGSVWYDTTYLLATPVL